MKGQAVRQIVLCFVVASGLLVGGCASTASFVTGVATEFSQSTPSQVTTLAEAYRAAALVASAADVAVLTGRLDRSELNEVQALRASVRAAMDVLGDANAAGKSLDFAVFNGALAAWNAYALSKGIST